MQKQPEIRWRKRDLELLQQEINRFNERVNYQKKKNPDANYLPEKANKNVAVGSIKTRTDYNRYIKSLKAFNAKTAKKVPREGQKASTVWAEKERKKERKRKEKEYKRKEEERNKQRVKTAEEIGEMEVTQAGKGTGVKRAEMGSIKENATTPTVRDVKKLTDKQLDEALEMIDRQIDPSHTRKKRELWQRNYIKALVREGYPSDVIELIKEIDPDDFAKIVDVDEYATIKFVYDPLEMQTRVNKIRETWSHYAVKKRSDWVEQYFTKHPELKETINQTSIDDFVHSTRNQIITDDNVLDLLQAYENDRIAFDVNVKSIRDEVAHEANQGYHGRRGGKIRR